MAISLEEKRNEIERRKAELNSANDLLAQYVGGSYQIPTMVKEGLNKKFNDNADLINQETGLQSQLRTTPANFAAEMTTGRFAGNPILAGQAAAQREASIAQKLNSLRQIRAQREGTFADVINAASGAYQAQTATAQQLASNAQQKYSMASDEYSQLYKEDQDAKDRATQQQQFDREMAYKYASLSSSKQAQTDANAGNFNDILGQLSTIFKQGDRSADFVDPSGSGQTVTREKMAGYLMSELGLDKEDALQMIYNNFKSKEEQLMGQTTNQNLNYELAQRIGKKLPTAKISLTKSNKSSSEDWLDY